jgi:hypothetical protein
MASMLMLVWSACGSKPDDARRAQLEQEVQQLRVENQELNSLREANKELPRLRRDHDELVRLRAETQNLPQLRQENDQLRAQLQALKAPKPRP